MYVICSDNYVKFGEEISDKGFIIEDFHAGRWVKFYVDDEQS